MVNMILYIFCDIYRPNLGGQVELSLDAPEVLDTYVFHSFFIHPTDGIMLIKESVVVSMNERDERTRIRTHARTCTRTHARTHSRTHARTRTHRNTRGPEYTNADAKIKTTTTTVTVTTTICNLI